MKGVRRISVLVLFVLCAMMSYADKDPVEHDFNALITASKIAFTNKNTTAETALLTYTCAGTNARFYQDFFNPDGKKLITINFQGSNDRVTTTAVDSLAEIFVYYDDEGSVHTFELRLSRDSVHWTDPIDPYNSVDGLVKYSFVPGRYHVRLTNTANNKTSIFKLTYSFGWCNCFLYIPE